MFCSLSSCYLEWISSWCLPFNAWWCSTVKTGVRGKINVVSVWAWYIWLIFSRQFVPVESNGRLQDWLQRHCCDCTRARLMVALAAFWVNWGFVLDYQNSTTFNGSVCPSLTNVKGRLDEYVKWFPLPSPPPTCIKNSTVKTGKKKLTNLSRKMSPEAYTNLIWSKHSSKYIYIYIN